MAKYAISQTNLIATMSPDAKYEHLKILCYLAEGNERRSYVTQFIEMLKEGFKPREFTYLDINIIAGRIRDLSRPGKAEQALDLIALSKRFMPLISQEQIHAFAVLYFYHIQALEMVGDDSRIKDTAEECLAFIESLPAEKSSSTFLGKAEMRRIKQFAESYLTSTSAVFASVPNREEKIERNAKITVRYKDGTVKRNIKYKKIRLDYEKGLCEVVE